MSSNKPWDARLACRLIYPLRDTKVRPNHLTLPLVTLKDQLVPFLIPAGIGRPLFTLWVLKEFLALPKKPAK